MDYTKFPQYYEVDDIPVKLYIDTKDDKVYAVNDLGNIWWNFGKVVVEGRRISRAEFVRLSKLRAIELGLKTTE